MSSDAAPSRGARERRAALALLALTSDASLREVRQRFRALARERHPDRGGDPEALRVLLDARDVLVRPASSSRLVRQPLLVVRRGPWWRRLVAGVARRGSYGITRARRG